MGNNENNNTASNEEYREQIIRMVNQMQDTLRLRRIFTVVHRGLLRELTERVDE